MLKISNLNKPHEHGNRYSEEVKIATITAFLATGNKRIAAATTGVSHQLVRLWATQPWWKEYEYEIKNTRRSQTNSKLSKLVDKSLVLIEDRLEHGDMVLNNKTGELVRKPVQLRDISKLANDMMERQEKLDRIKIDESSLQQKDTMQDTLKMLAEEFAKFNGSKRKEIIDVTDVTVKEDNAVHAEEWEEGLQEGEREVQLEAGECEEAGGEKPSTFPDDEGGLSPKGGW